MKLQEIHRSGVTDNEDLGEHSRTAATVSFNVSFAHETGLEEAFSGLMAHPSFVQELEKEFATLLHRKLQERVRASTIQPGNGWTDDFEVEASVSPKEANTL